MNATMHRQPLFDLLARYAAANPQEQDLVARFTAFAAQHADCLLRSCVPGHLTASCWIVAPDRRHVLLTHHRKLGRWLQLGGHADGEANLAEAARREAQEESGIAELTLLTGAACTELLVPLDLDVHPIPARRDEPEHLHWDVRFLFVVPFEQPLVLSAESKALEWVPVDGLQRRTDEFSVLRLAAKAQRLGAHC